MSNLGMNDSAMSGEPSGSHPVLVSPGAQLAAHRQERGWTVEQVASHLNLAPRQVIAIEADDYPSLPGMAIVRGFVRQYAKLLKIDAAPLLAALGGETVLAHESIRPRQSLSTPFSEARLPSMTERQSASSSRLVLGVLLVALAGAAAWVFLSDKDIAGMSKAATSQVKDGIAQMTVRSGTAAPSAEQANPAAGESKGAADAVVSMPVTPPLDPNPVTPQPSAASPSSAAVPSTTTQPPAATSSQAATLVQPAQPSVAPAVAGKDTLVIKARQDSWIEVKRTGGGQPMVSRLLKAGESESVEVTESVVMVIGNAAGVDASLRGSALELKAPGNSNVARLTLK